MHDAVKNLDARLHHGLEEQNGFIGFALSSNPFAAPATFELLTRPCLRSCRSARNFGVGESAGYWSTDSVKACWGRRLIRLRVDDGRAYLPERHESEVFYSVID